MAAAATLLTEALIPAAKTAVGDVGASGGAPEGLSGQAQLLTPFADLLAEGNFVQAPGLIPVDGEGAPDLAALLSKDQAGMAAKGEDVTKVDTVNDGIQLTVNGISVPIEEVRSVSESPTSVP